MASIKIKTNFASSVSSLVNIEDEGLPIVSTQDLNFVGAGVTVTENPLGTAEITIPGGGGIGGTNYIYVMADGIDTANAAELSAAYATAIALIPSATNRITIVCGPGYYNFSSNFTMNTQYIDLVSLDGNKSVILTGTTTIQISANDVFVKGVDVGTKPFNVDDGLSLVKVENCKGGSGSFGLGFVGGAQGTFTNCVADSDSFSAFGGVAQGTYINCTAGDRSFGSSFGSAATGIFINCVAGNDSFGSDGVCSGTFTNCIASNNSFGGGAGILTGKLYFCRLTAGIFQTVSGAGVTRLCLDGSNIENNQG